MERSFSFEIFLRGGRSGCSAETASGWKPAEETKERSKKKMAEVETRS